MHFLIICICLVNFSSLWAQRDQEIKILLLQPMSTAKYLKAEDAELMSDSWLTSWKRILSELEYQYEIELDNSIGLDFKKYDLVILPDALCLGDAILTELKSYLKHGGACLATWGTGCRFLDGEWRGFDFLETYLGSAPEASDFTAGSQMALLLRYGHPGTVGVPPGYYLRVKSERTPFYLKGKSKGDIGGYLSESKYNNASPDKLILQSGYVTRRLRGRGRFAWFGTSLAQINTDEDNWQHAISFFDNLLSWLVGKGTMTIDPWSKGYNSAVMIHGDIEHEFANVVNTARLFKSLDVPVTYNIVTDAGARNTDILRILTSTRGEIAIFGDTHDTFLGQSLKKQSARMEKSVRFISLHAPKPVGFRPPEGVYDDNTINAAVKLELSYINAFSLTDRCYPVLGDQSADLGYNNSIVFFPKSELDDYDLTERLFISDNDMISNYMFEDFERIYDLMGLYKLNFSSDNFARQELLIHVESVINKIKLKEDVWIATAADIATWVRNRQNLEVTFEHLDNAIKIEITNIGDQISAESVLRIQPPGGIDPGLLTVKTLSKSTLFDQQDNVFLLDIPSLDPSESFHAGLVTRSGLPFNATTKGILKWIIRISLVLAVLFIGTSAWYFSIAKKRVTVSSEYEFNEDDKAIQKKAKSKFRRKKNKGGLDKDGESDQLRTIINDADSDPFPFTELVDYVQAKRMEAKQLARRIKAAKKAAKKTEAESTQPPPIKQKSSAPLPTSDSESEQETSVELTPPEPPLRSTAPLPHKATSALLTAKAGANPPEQAPPSGFVSSAKTTTRSSAPLPTQSSPKPTGNEEESGLTGSIRSSVNVLSKGGKSKKEAQSDWV